MNRSELRNTLNVYSSSFPEELLFLSPFKKLLAHRDCYIRTHLPGHLTGSAWVLNQSYTKVLMLHHAKLNKWLQPGGHADGEENLGNVALKELQEETGLQGAQLISKSIFDLDIHPIPQRGNMPAHDHYDVRFAFLASDEEHLTINCESNDLQWVALDSLEAYNAERSVLRMKEKTIALLSAN